jgi:tetratricopeptide (TPR) repeat protein
MSATGAGGAALRKLAEAMRLQQAGSLDAAEAVYAALLREHPDDPTALINAGVLAVSRGDAAQAIDRLARALRHLPRNAIAHNNLGFAHLQAGDPAEALKALEAAVALQPDYAQAHNNRGIALTQLGRSDEAIAAFERALVLDARMAEAATNLGDLHARAGRADAALSAFDRALAVNGASIPGRTGHAFARALGGDLDGARTQLEHMVAEAPTAHAAWKTLGAVCNWAWDHAAAERAFRVAVARRNDDFEAAFGIASTLLARGDYRAGFAAFERRPDRADALPHVGRIAVWDGAPLQGALLLYAEQGLGDVVQFARFVARARERAPRVVVLLDEYWHTLAPLIATAHGIDRIVTSQVALADEAPVARASLLSLPHVLGVTPQTLGPVPYLHAPAERLEAWTQRLAHLAHPRVGLAWSVHARSDYGYVTRHKSVPAAALAPLLDTPGTTFVSLQPGDAGDPSVFGAAAARVVDHRAALEDFGDTAALIASLDLVIAPDTAVAHVAGALGVPVWLLDRYNSCWRWRLAPETSPWYPTLRIFRQQRFGDWSAPIARVVDALRAWRGAARA